MAHMPIGKWLLAFTLTTQAIPRGTPVGDTTIPGSARTLISSVTTSHPSGPRIELLVIWRGTPGWYLKSGERHSSGGGSGHSYSSTLRYGGTEVSFEFVAAAARRVILPDRSVDLGDHNVVLVDDVDAASGPRFVKSLRIDPSLVDARALAPAVARSAEVVEFLQCAVTLESVSAKRTTGGICEAVGRAK